MAHLWVNSPYAAMFSKLVCCRGVRKRLYVGKGLMSDWRYCSFNIAFVHDCNLYTITFIIKSLLGVEIHERVNWLIDCGLTPLLAFSLSYHEGLFYHPSMYFLFIYLLRFYAAFNSISVISRRQFTYSWSLGKRTSTRLDNVPCPRALHLDRGAATGDRTMYFLTVMNGCESNRWLSDLRDTNSTVTLIFVYCI